MHESWVISSPGRKLLACLLAFATGKFDNSQNLLAAFAIYPQNGCDVALNESVGGGLGDEFVSVAVTVEFCYCREKGLK